MIVLSHPSVLMRCAFGKFDTEALPRQSQPSTIGWIVNLISSWKWRGAVEAFNHLLSRNKPLKEWRKTTRQFKILPGQLFHGGSIWLWKAAWWCEWGNSVAAPRTMNNNNNNSFNGHEMCERCWTWQRHTLNKPPPPPKKENGTEILVRAWCDSTDVFQLVPKRYRGALPSPTCSCIQRY